MKGNKRISKKGFTLIELLVVIAIIAILSVVVILTLNPAELLRQSRDSNRVSDLSVTKSAIAFYLASVTIPVLESSTELCHFSNYTTSTNAMTATDTCQWFVGASTPGPLSGRMATTTQNGGSRTVDGNGWININFTAITAGGSPLAQLPVDPINTGNNYYTYTASQTLLAFKLATQMESAKYSAGGSNDVVTTDGGFSSQAYEQGTNVQL